MNVRFLIEGGSEMRKICVAIPIAALSGIPLLLTAAPQAVRDVVARIDIRGLPTSVRTQVDTQLSGRSGQPFTSATMLRVNDELERIDPRIVRQWIEEKPGQYSLTLTYRREEPSHRPTITLIDVSRLPESLQTTTAERLDRFRNAPFTTALIEEVRNTILQVDHKIAARWFNDPDGSMVLALAYDLPDQAWQRIFGVLARLDVAQISEPMRSQIAQRLAPFLNGPISNARMQAIGKEVRQVAPNLMVQWRAESKDTFVLTLFKQNAPFAPLH
jgi:hypothetical protein